MSPRVPPARSEARLLASLLLPLVTGACGYEAGFPLQADGVRTIAVEVAGNETFRQGLEIPLTRQLHEALPRHSGLVVTSREEADARLVVDIVEAQGPALVVGGATPIKEGALDLALRVRLVRRDGTVLREKRILDRAEFRVPVGENLSTATRESSYDLARKIVLSLEPDF